MSEHECGGSLEWSGTYGTSPRRVYWRCQDCGRIGAVLFPPCSEFENRYPSRSFTEADKAFEECAEQFACESALEFVVHASEDWLAKRNRFRPLDLVEFSRDVWSEMYWKVKRALTEQVNAERKLLYEAHHREMAAINKLRDSVRRKVKRAPPRTHKPIRPPESTLFPILFGEGDTNPVRPIIYGLVDPRERERVRYVGQTITPHARYLAHLKDGQEPDGKKAAWIGGLAAASRAPEMVLLESIRAGRDMNEPERWWIRSLQSIGQADLNTTVPAGRPRAGAA